MRTTLSSLITRINAKNNSKGNLRSVSVKLDLGYQIDDGHSCLAGKFTTNEELEELLENPNPGIFIQDVSVYGFNRG